MSTTAEERALPGAHYSSADNHALHGIQSFRLRKADVLMLEKSLETRVVLTLITVVGVYMFNRNS